jgi:hypothetical protein
MSAVNFKQNDIRNDAVQRLEYINLIIMTAASDPVHLPYLMAHHEYDQRLFAQHLGSFACLMLVHLQDMARTLLGTETNYGRIGDFRSLILDTQKRVAAGGDPRAIIHQHMRNLFAFDAPVRSDAGGEYQSPVSPYYLAVEWMMDVLVRIECGQTLPEILGLAQNSEVCTKLCFARAIDTLQLWQRDLRLIIPGTASIM